MGGSPEWPLFTANLSTAKFEPDIAKVHPSEFIAKLKPDNARLKL